MHFSSVLLYFCSFIFIYFFFFFSSRRRHTRLQGDWSSDVCSSDLLGSVWMRGRALRSRTFDKEAIRRVLAADNFWGIARSEERRVGKECRSRWSPYH